ncbi:hypothetical protein AMAG_03321 [Allomyces macrogynus ATCC 38327]|uniref:RGS domain-containing protein n=1 Tax=Allomyces macrogynus (strain ATCC 38327) TaxID=578462 RepID=A0A0L0S997_ALLM3|nr:hypothetical protein AMAG_03321 [Allomyces macrogynus ATCC 38327]|eukprot:KNE58964.1 hypothetical protein AMAG_03321 [Allomyces macrogynus ATCC 38327]
MAPAALVTDEAHSLPVRSLSPPPPRTRSASPASAPSALHSAMDQLAAELDRTDTDSRRDSASSTATSSSLLTPNGSPLMVPMDPVTGQPLPRVAKLRKKPKPSSLTLPPLESNGGSNGEDDDDDMPDHDRAPRVITTYPRTPSGTNPYDDIPIPPIPESPPARGRAYSTSGGFLAPGAPNRGDGPRRKSFQGLPSPLVPSLPAVSPGIPPGEEFPDVPLVMCHKYGLQKLLISRIPLAYFLAHHIDTFAPENLFFVIDVIIFHTHPGKIFDTYLAMGAPFELNIPDPVRLRALEAWSTSDPVGCFEAVQRGVMPMLETTWNAFKKTTEWTSLCAYTKHSYSVADRDRAVRHLVLTLNKRYPIRTGDKTDKVPKALYMSTGGSSEDASGVIGDPDVLTRAKTVAFLRRHLYEHEMMPDEVLAMLTNKEHKMHGKGSILKSLFGGWGKRRA